MSTDPFHRTIRIVEYSDTHSEHGVRVQETAALSASPIACAVADAWVKEKAHPYNGTAWLYGDPRGNGLTAASGSRLGEALDALEAATRESPLRKVRP